MDNGCIPFTSAPTTSARDSSLAAAPRRSVYSALLQVSTTTIPSPISTTAQPAQAILPLNNYVSWPSSASTYLLIPGLAHAHRLQQPPRPTPAPGSPLLSFCLPAPIMVDIREFQPVIFAKSGVQSKAVMPMSSGGHPLRTFWRNYPFEPLLTAGALQQAPKASIESMTALHAWCLSMLTRSDMCRCLARRSAARFHPTTGLGRQAAVV